MLKKDAIPVSDELTSWAAESKTSVWNYVFNGGEDYELIFTMEPADFHSLQSEYSDVTKIGVVRSGNGDVLLVDGDTESILAPTGWTHF